MLSVSGYIKDLCNWSVFSPDIVSCLETSSQFQSDKMYFIMSSWTYVYIFPFKLFDSKWKFYCWNYEKWIQLFFSTWLSNYLNVICWLNHMFFHWHKISFLKKTLNIPIYLGCLTFLFSFIDMLIHEFYSISL